MTSISSHIIRTYTNSFNKLVVNDLSRASAAVFLDARQYCLLLRDINTPSVMWTNEVTLLWPL
jgi:hypothetical protein